MKKRLAVLILAGGALWPLACGKNLSPTALGPVTVVQIPSTSTTTPTTTPLITTYAGNGTGGYSGDDGPAVSAELYSPYGVAVDASGNLYIADSGNNRIRKVN